MSIHNVQDLIEESHGDVVTMLRNSPHRPFVGHPGNSPEFSNWRDEQIAWRERVVLLDQTHHMDALYIKGARAHELIRDTGVNGINFAVDSAKQYVAVNPRGHVVADGILFREAEDEFMLVGRAAGVDWLTFNAEHGGYGLDIEVDRRSLQYPLGRPANRRFWRFQIQGPRAWQVIEKLNGGPVEQAKFFHAGTMNIAGQIVRTVRHGIAGAPGLEIWGPFETYLQTREAILDAGAEFGIAAVGALAYSTTGIESGWIPAPVPAIYSHDDMRPYREWLSPRSYFARFGLGGSFVGETIDDYYLNPWELGYGNFVKFDHDFIGRSALESIEPPAQRRKVTFAWNPDDVTQILGSSVRLDGPQYKYLELPLATYATSCYDRIETADGELVGFSLSNAGYTANERSVLSLGILDHDVPIGAELYLVWGEPDGGTAKPAVERHEQFRVRVVASPAPYSKVARDSYRAGWRTELASS